MKTLLTNPIIYLNDFRKHPNHYSLFIQNICYRLIKIEDEAHRLKGYCPHEREDIIESARKILPSFINLSYISEINGPWDVNITLENNTNFLSS